MSDYLTTDGRGEVLLMLVLWSDWFGGRGGENVGGLGDYNLSSVTTSHILELINVASVPKW